jgi:lysyl-tRNA synthetase class 2
MKNRQTRIQKNLHARARILQAVRMFFEKNGFLEVDTPIRIPAPAPEQYIEPVTSDGWALQTSPELCMKRLLAAGYSRIYQICKCFRGRERGGKHLPEFTMLEWYCADIEYHGFMDQCEDLIRFVAAFCSGGSTLAYNGHRVDLSGPWQRISVPEAFRRWGSISLGKALSTDRFDEVMVTDIEPNLGFEKPVFLYDYPARRAALAKLSPVDPTLAQRYELYICGIELCNAFMELTDPKEQRRRFEAEQQEMRASGKPVYPMPEPFLSALGTMPDAGVNARGLDRLVMLRTDVSDIDDVVAFTPEEL